MIIPGAKALSEDFTRFQGFIIGCGEASALVVDHIMKGTPLSYQELYNLISDASKSGHLDYGMGQTANSVAWDLQHTAGLGSTIHYGAQGLQTFIETALAHNVPVILGVSNANRSLTGEMNTGVQGHFVTIVGENSSGNYIVADPNTPQAATGGFVNDTIGQILSANPFAAIQPTGAGPSGSGTPGSNIPVVGGVIDIGSAIAQLASNLSPQNVAQDIGTGIASGIGNAISSVFFAPFKAVGITDFKDFATRTLLITIAVIFVIIGLIALFHTQIENAGNKTDEAASMAAIAA